jgi:GT2 family glycosyltransferase
MLEIVVVEEGDNPKPIDGVKYVFLPRLNKGFGFTRNTAVENCSNDLIAFVDDDCEVTPEWLNELLKCLDDTIAGVTGGVLVKNCNIIGYCENLLGLPAGGLKKIDEAKNSTQTTEELITCNALIRKKAIIAAGGFDCTRRTQYSGEDSLLSYNIIDKGYQLIYSPTAIVYHKTKDNLMKNFFWAIRMGKSRFFFNRIINKKQSILTVLRTSIFVKLFIFAIGLILFHRYALYYIILVLALYWLKILIRYLFCRKYIRRYIPVLLILPIVKFVFDLGLAVGQLRGPSLFKKLNVTDQVVF